MYISGHLYSTLEPPFISATICKRHTHVWVLAVWHCCTCYIAVKLLSWVKMCKVALIYYWVIKADYSYQNYFIHGYSKWLNAIIEIRACFNMQWCTKCAVMNWNVQWWKAVCAVTKQVIWVFVTRHCEICRLFKIKKIEFLTPSSRGFIYLFKTIFSNFISLVKPKLQHF